MLRRVVGALFFVPALFAQDTVFDPHFVPQPGGPVLALHYQPDGKLLVGGSFTRIANVARNNFARLDVTGAAEPGFAPSFAGGAVYAVAQQATGKIIVGGSFRTVGGRDVPLLVRLNTDGSRTSRGLGSRDCT